MSRLHGLEVENVKGIRAVQIEFGEDDAVIRIRGENEAGKSSLLDALQYLIGGAKTHPPHVIRMGEKTAKVVGKTDEYIATRRWWLDEHGKECTELELRAVDGSPLKSPQALLNKLFNDNALLPEAYSELDKHKKLEVLRKLVGVDTTALDEEHVKLYEQRRQKTKRVEELRGRLTGMMTKEPPPRVDVAAMQQQQREAQLLWDATTKTQRARDAAMQRTADAEMLVRNAEEANARAKLQLEQAKAVVDERRKAAAELDNAADAAEEAAAGCHERIAALSTQMREATALAAEHERWKERQRVAAEFEKEEKTVNDWTARLGVIEHEKQELVAAAKFPVAGLSFGTDGVLYNGVPLEQASSAAQIRVSLGIARAMNPKLRIVLVRKGSLLDGKAMRELEAICKEQEFQALVELVGEDGPATVVIRDGAVAVGGAVAA